MKIICTAAKHTSPVHKIVTAVLLIAAVTGGMLVFSGCFFAKKYKVDYNGQKSSFSNAKDNYRAGEKVELYFPYIATDTNYMFYVDGEQYNALYEDGKGYVIKFTMPERDVSVKVASKNSMIEDPSDNPDAPYEATMLVDYYTAVAGTVGGDNSHEMVLYYHSDDDVMLSVFDKDEDSGETRTDYIVPIKALGECKEVIRRNKFDTWNKKYGDTAIDGGATVVKYLNDKNETVRVSTDRMPDDGLKRLGEIASVLHKYTLDKYKVQ
ncbi:MAG: hypothetical protein IJT79_07120 [Ruminococcus sp.]|nr:hypothetical protein [Ruminococcus sp.]